MIQRLILLDPRLPAETHRAPSCLPFAEPFFGLAFFLLPPADLALFMAFPTALRVSVLTTAFTTTFPIPPMWLPILSYQGFCPKKRRVALGPAVPPPPLVRTLVGSLRALETSTLGFVLDVDLFAPYVFLDDLRVLHNVLADAHLFLDDRALAHDDLFLSHRHHNLVLADLGLRSLALDGHPLHADFLVAGGNLDAFAVGSHALTDLELTGLALAGACGELFLGALHPELALVGQVGAIDHACRLGGLLGVVALIGAALLG